MTQWIIGALVINMIVLCYALHREVKRSTNLEERLAFCAPQAKDGER